MADLDEDDKPKIVDLTDPDCEDCDGTGHVDGCEARQPAWDLDDLMYRQACDACCPRGHQSDGLQALQDRTTRKLHKLTGR